MKEFFIGNIKGDKGDVGPKGDKGDKGDTGQGFKVIDYYATPEALTSVITNPSVGDAYGVGSGQPYDIYIYSQSNGWVNNGALQGAKGDTGPQGEKGDKGDTGEKGDKGDTGDVGTPATIMSATASVDDTTGIPSVSVELGGTASTRSFNFLFSGLKGAKGDKGDTPTVDINALTPEYEEESTLKPLTVGDNISITFGKIKKAITDFISHLADTTSHITSTERTAWNNKAATLHASTGTAYGVGNETNYGHLKITDSLTSTETGTAASAKAIKSVADALSALQNSDSNIQIVSSSYVGTGTYVNGQETPTNIAAGQNKLTFPAFPRIVLIKKSSSYRVNAVIMPNPTTKEVSFITYGDSKWYQGRCSGKVESDNSLTWYALTQVWKYKADLTTGDVSVELEKLATESYNLKAYGQLNELGVAYDYVAICY